MKIFSLSLRVRYMKRLLNCIGLVERWMIVDCCHKLVIGTFEEKENVEKEFSSYYLGFYPFNLELFETG